MEKGLRFGGGLFLWWHGDVSRVAGWRRVVRGGVA